MIRFQCQIAMEQEAIPLYVTHCLFTRWINYLLHTKWVQTVVEALILLIAHVELQSLD